MPRQARRKSKSGIYHVMLRGINKQVIFEDEEDSLKFLETLKNYKAISGYKIFAYCLMSNHIHLLLKVEKENLDLIIKRIAGSYVYWYNWKYHRSGHLFQDRFKSEPVEDDMYFLTVIRYMGHKGRGHKGTVLSCCDFTMLKATLSCFENIKLIRVISIFQGLVTLIICLSFEVK